MPLAIVAGIDEAGYGPILGPLVVSRVAFEVPDDLARRNLWSLLQGSVTSRISQRDRRLPILDSKKLHHSQDGLGAVEQSSLAMLATTGPRRATFSALIRALCPEVEPDLHCYPWYRRFECPLPLACNSKVVDLKANAVSYDLKQRGARFLGARSRVLPEGHFNRLVERTGNKATVLWSQTLTLLGETLRRAGDRRVMVFVDRQGGRIHYIKALLTAFEGATLKIISEKPESSRYLLTRNGATRSEALLEFRQSAESAHLPVALASIFSKYLRELFMLALNRYWQDRVRELKGTAGYFSDGRRFLRDIEPALQSLDIDRRLLVRVR